MFIISAPSGAGKTTLCRGLLSSVRNIQESVSYTSRSPREGEVDGRDYSFVSAAVFREMMARGEFVEWAEVHGNLYGTSSRRLSEMLDGGTDVLLDIDTQGADQIRKTFRGGVFIFVLPPSLEILRRRIEDRGSNTREDMERRLMRAADEIRDFSLYDYVIVNDQLETALEQLTAIITAERLRVRETDAAWIRRTFLGTE